MKKWTFEIALLALLCMSASATAQSHMGPRHPPKDEPGNADPTLSLDPRHTQCAAGDQGACFSIEFRNCAAANPNVAVTACTRQLTEAENRRQGSDIRYERAIRYLLRGNAHLKLGNTENALADYDRAIIADQTVYWIHAQRGDANFLAGNFDEALVSYNAALAWVEDNASVLNNRALIYAAAPNDGLRNPAQALSDAQRANMLLPGQPAYIDVLGVAHAANGDFETAANEAERAIGLLPPGNDSVLADFRGRLDLYRSSTAFRITPPPGA
jgi:tetratricopeptide (TPR) repeat protein